jgi:glycosyltransferase involved in cell wall biosynthesis
MDTMQRILFLPMGDRTLASSRYRLYQYVDHAADHGVAPRILDWASVRGRSARLRTAAQTLMAAPLSNAVFIQKRHDAAALWAAKLGRRVIFDFDDAIWLPPPNDRRDPAKIPRLLEQLHAVLHASDLVMAGNATLRDYAAQYNANVAIVPTVVDLDQYTLAPKPPSDMITLGWVGSKATVMYLDLLNKVFAALAQRYPGRVRLKVISDVPYQHPTLPVENVAWSLREEVDQLRDIDIGLMPLRDSEWERGKCGFKLLQYMALGIAAVGAPVGVNTTILQHGINGLLASSADEWLDALTRLIEDNNFRQTLGEAGRKTIEAHYSLQALAPRFWALVQDA